MHPSPRALTLAASIGWRHAAADPVRALLLAWRVLPAPLRGWLRLAGPYGRAAVLWGAGERDAALASLAGSPRRLAAFALAADQPAAAAAAVDRLARDDRRRPVLAARLAWREGRLTEALRALDNAPGRQARRLRATLTAEQTLLAAPTGPVHDREQFWANSARFLLTIMKRASGRAAAARRTCRGGCCTWSPTRCPRRAPGTRSGRTRSRWPSAKPGSIRTSRPERATR